MSVTPQVMRRLMKELAEMQRSPPEGVRIQTSEDNMLDVMGIVEGPEGTPYAGGYFKVKFNFTEEFPAAPPKCRMLTKIFHPNVSSAGEICVNTLKKDWQSSYGIAHILVVVKCLLIHPNPDSALDEEAGRMLQENYDSYCDRAKLITSVHATPKVKPVEFQTPSSTPRESGGKEDSGKVATTPITTATTAPSTPVSHPTPVSSRKSVSPAPQTNPLKAPASTGKERHVSPAPLSTADANVRSVSKTSSTAGDAREGLGLRNGTGPGGNGTKAVKRAATGGASGGAEKRKKALKRL